MDVGAMTVWRRCEYCAHFLQEELNTGYCQFHDMYVLRDFDCGKFEQRSTRAEGGDRPAASQEEERKRA